MVGESESDNKVSCIPYVREQRRVCVRAVLGVAVGENVYDVRAWERQEARDLA